MNAHVVCAALFALWISFVCCLVQGALMHGATIPPFGEWPRVLQVFAALDAGAVLLILWLFVVAVVRPKRWRR